MSGLLLLITTALAVTTVIVGQHLEWTVPPSTATQVQDIEAALEPCQKGIPSSYEKLREGQPLILIVESSACPAAGELRYYRYHHERLQQLFSEGPREGSGSWSVSCIGPEPDPCLLAVGHSLLTAAAFRDPTRGQLLPLLLYPSGHGGGNAPRLRVPFLPEPPRTKDPDAAVERSLRMLALRPGAPIDAATAGAGAGQCLRGALCGYPAEGLVALPAQARQHPAVLAAGYLAGGPPEAPTLLRAQAWEISVPRQGTLLVGSEPCLIFKKGLLDPVALVRPGESPRAALSRLFADTSVNVVC